MEFIQSKFNYNNLSVKDLVEARDLFHVHLINKRNVEATAIGRYRIRKNDPWPNEPGYKKSLAPNPKKEPRTLENSEVRAYSWPCILVFVNQWEDPSDLMAKGQDNMVPSAIYLPDGRIVPICVVEAPKSQFSNDLVDESQIIFPSNLVGGGFPLLLRSQGIERVASIGCVVTDGNRFFALTNKHVTGVAGTPIYTKMKGIWKQIGVSSGLDLGKVRFPKVYPGWKGANIMVNNDVGLIEIDDIRKWKTDVFGIGMMDELANLNVNNISLQLITTINTVDSDSKIMFPTLKAFGAVSGELSGEIVALFYRYKTIGGNEYVADFLIGGAEGKPLEIHHGDSGTLWLIDYENKRYPFALQWGQHNFIQGEQQHYYPYALATNLSNILSELNVDLVRGWNIDQDYTWGKTGHFKIGAKACELVSNPKLAQLLMANQSNIGYTDQELIDNNVVSGRYSDSKDVFVPLTDVADIIWRSKRKKDSSNHFADIDERLPDSDDTLLSLCMADERNIDIDFWLEQYAKLDAISPGKKPRDGALPFRVGQMYLRMIEALKKKDIPAFIAAGGTLSHYVGDACQPLHISYLHHGRDTTEEDVHEEYETKMLDRHRKELFIGVNEKSKRVKPADLIDGTGRAAAKRLIELSNQIYSNLPALEICESFAQHRDEENRYGKMWADLGNRTIENIAEGSRVLAILWQSAWKAGNGNSIPSHKLVQVDPMILKALYDDKTFVPSYRLHEPEFKNEFEGNFPA